MNNKTLPVLLVTANVGSIFEDPLQMLKLWAREFLSCISKLQPKFIALHCQEVGGKNYENSMKHVQHFVNFLTSSDELRAFNKIRVFLDEDYSSAENFTALGNFYFVHESVDDVAIWDFKAEKFAPVHGTEIFSGNIEAVVTKEKAKFPQDFFPECKWSRKGFLRTRWSVNGTVFDLVNIHLFHDASNFVAMETCPSVYSQNRRRALEHTLQRFHNDSYGRAPGFIFGDFNFRTDTDGVVKKLAEGLTTTRIQNNKNADHTKLQYTNDECEPILTVGKKEFHHAEHQTVFLSPSETWLQTYDKELEAFKDYLTEFPVTFPPSYPFEEKITEGSNYMQTRCPAWCDRILLMHTARKLVCEEQTVEYGLIGRNTCMGDHKPVYLRVDLLSNSGTIRCCEHAPYECLPVTCQCCQSFACVTINVTDMSDYFTRPTTDIDSRLLHEPLTKEMLSHEPYTPESADSHSPIPETNRQLFNPNQLKDRLEEIQSPMKRSASQDVEKSPLGGFRTRAMSEVQGKMRMRLISSASVSSVLRLQSHHSSSDEEWFEIDENSNSKRNSGEGCGSLEKGEQVVLGRMDAVKEKRETARCCCIF